MLSISILGLGAWGCDSAPEEVDPPSLVGQWSGEGLIGNAAHRLEVSLRMPSAMTILGDGVLAITEPGGDREVGFIAEGTYDFPAVDFSITGGDGSLRFFNGIVEDDGSAIVGALRTVGDNPTSFSLTLTR